MGILFGISISNMSRSFSQEAKRTTAPTPEEAAEYIRTHNGSTPPASWYPNGDPWRNLTAKEAEEMLKDCEDTPENRKKWAAAGMIVKPDKSERSNKMTNTQARAAGAEEWHDYGDVSMYEAARREAVRTSLSAFGSAEYSWWIEVQHEGDSTVPMSRVQVRTKVVAEVIGAK